MYNAAFHITFVDNYTVHVHLQVKMSHPSLQAKPSNPSNPQVFFDVDMGGD